ncbi:hypothetical protein CWE15_10265 [Aliidiomarina taiwanensis]|uniref:Uncharacterized protein n=1 Tax=Aliidiomarina taiwanensis TaxID=946228 RepID=A0A432WYW9_9GAMM|nr:hypothetical protein [Aliidiomarina taiwanensis]RUO38881.1 hypothetical protein CWE15_10265 [Aliidiomarina taiwanensis]
MRNRIRPYRSLTDSEKRKLIEKALEKVVISELADKKSVAAHKKKSRKQLNSRWGDLFLSAYNKA